MKFTVKDFCEGVICGWETCVRLLNKNGNRLYEEYLDIAKKMLKKTEYYLVNITNIKIENKDKIITFVLTLEY